jgi:hypothetical protein
VIEQVIGQIIEEIIEKNRIQNPSLSVRDAGHVRPERTANLLAWRPLDTVLSGAICDGCFLDSLPGALPGGVASESLSEIYIEVTKRK